MPNSQNTNHDTPEPLSKDILIDTYKKILGLSTNWVLFKHGTCIVPQHKTEDIGSQAIELLTKYGPVQTGTPTGDFNVMNLTAIEGWIITGQHPEIVNYVSPSELGFDITDYTDYVVGLLGRSNRDLDTKNPEIIHVQNDGLI